MATSRRWLPFLSLLIHCLASSASFLSPPFPCTPSSPPPEFWNHLASQLSSQADLVLPSSPEFHNATHHWNILYTRSPFAVVFTKTPQDVAVAVALARSVGLCVVPRSSGHAFGGTSVLDSRLVIDVSALSTVTYDAGANRLSAGPGSNLHALVDACELADVVTVWGGCGSVCLGGYLQGGGEGNLDRMLGVGLDQVTQFDIVLPNGTLVTDVSSESVDPAKADLFWAVRGGGGPGGNFGIVTQWHLQTSPVANFNEVIRFSISLSAADGVEGVLRFFSPSPPEFAAGAGIEPSGQVTLSGWWLGDVEEGKTFLANLVKGLPSAQTTMAVMGIFAASRLDFEYWDKVPSVGFVGRSLYTEQMPSRVQLAQVFSELANARTAANVTTSLQIFLTGDKVNDVDPAATAYPHRNVIANVELAIQMRDPSTFAALNPEIQAWADGFYQSFLVPAFAVDADLGKWGVYANLMDDRLERPLEHYYQGNLDRLQHVKADIDPDYYFNFPQSIPPVF